MRGGEQRKRGKPRSSSSCSLKLPAERFKRSAPATLLAATGEFKPLPAPRSCPSRVPGKRMEPEKLLQSREWAESRKGRSQGNKRGRERKGLGGSLMPGAIFLNSLQFSGRDSGRSCSGSESPGLVGVGEHLRSCKYSCQRHRSPLLSFFGDKRGEIRSLQHNPTRTREKLHG